jgi:hypothetical protein
MLEDEKIMSLLVGALPAVAPNTGEDDVSVLGGPQRRAPRYLLADAGSHADAEVNTALMLLVALRNDLIGVIPLLLCGDVSSID